MLSRLFCSTVVLVALLVAGGVARAVDASSPFLAPVPAGAAVAATEGAPLELKGIMQARDGYRYSIFNPSKRTSTWSQLNDASGEFVVKSHDVDKDTVTVEYQGRSFTLGLKAGKVQSGGPAGNAPQMAGGGGGGFQAQAVVNPTPADESRRLEAVADEVRRRRAAREATAQMMAGPPGAPAGAPSASPMTPPLAPSGAPVITSGYPPPPVQQAAPQGLQQPNRRTRNRNGQQP